MPKENANFIIERQKGSHSWEDVKRTLTDLQGVTSVSLNDAHHLISLDYDSACASYDQIENQLNKLGFEIAADASEIQTR